MHRRAHRPAIRSLLAALAILCLTALAVGQADASPRAGHDTRAAAVPTCLPSGVVPPGAPLPTCLPGGVPSLGAPALNGPADAPSCLPDGVVPSQLPVPSCVPDIAAGGVPTGVPTCLPANGVPSQLPLPSCLALPVPSPPLPSCLPLPTGVVPTQVPVPICPPSGSSTTETTPSPTGTPPVTTTSSQIATVPAGGVDTGGGPDLRSGLVPALAVLAGIGATAGLILWRRRRLGWG